MLLIKGSTGMIRDLINPILLFFTDVVRRVRPWAERYVPVGNTKEEEYEENYVFSARRK